MGCARAVKFYKIGIVLVNVLFVLRKVFNETWVSICFYIITGDC